MPTTLPLPETIEGTWEEIQRQASKFNGHRLRVTILPAASSTISAKPIVELRPTGRYAVRIRAEMEAESETPTPEEIAEAEREIEEMKQNMNENRRRDGAEPIF
jgi:hypothetical protein